MAADSISPLTSGASALLTQGVSLTGEAAGSTKPASAKDAAAQFEGLLLNQMLESAHESNPGSLSGDDDDDAESDTAFSIAAQQFAQIMAKQGGFGLAKLVTQGLTREK